MNLIQAIVYGVVQGLTEFLPISSTAHLRLVPALLHWTDPGSAFTAVIQLGTVLAVFIYFWKDLSAAFMAWARSLSGDKSSVEAKTGWAVFYATIPIVIIGLVLHKYIEGPLRSLWVIGGSMIAMGVLMGFADKGQGGRDLKTVEPMDGLKIGLWQCLALIPGMSRSGSTISGALLTGFDRAAAARLSFLMSVPAVTLAGLYEGAKEFKHLSGGMMTPTLVSTFVSFVVGYACIGWLISFLSRKGTRPFVAYRIILGLLLFGLCAAHVIDPVDHSSDTANVSSQTTTAN